jgi:DNA-directed RNA polymerase specialized sigma24 family protein
MYLVMGPVGGRERWSDGELLSAIAGRDREAFSVFYRRHLSETVAYLLSETHNRELAADLTAEVFAAVLLSARRYRPERDTATPWVIGIARNTLGASRRRSRDRARGLGPRPHGGDRRRRRQRGARAGRVAAK